MSSGGFKWVEPIFYGLDDLDDDSPIGRVYEVDITYPEELHEKHNDLPFLPMNGIPPDSEVKKLKTTFKRKTNYIIHYRTLKQVIIEKVYILFLMYDYHYNVMRKHYGEKLNLMYTE